MDEDERKPEPKVTVVQGAVEGVIKPPPGIQLLIEKTASHVATNGKQFEDNIKKLGKAKFDFLNPSHPYHLYYSRKVDEIAVQQHLSAQKKKQTTNDKTSDTAPGASTGSSSSTAETKEKAPVPEEENKDEVVFRAPKLSATADALKKKRDQPPPDYMFTSECPPASGTPVLIVDIIKLCARYGAVLGRTFVQQIAIREQYNPEFSFLKPGDDNFPYFTSLVDKYSGVLDFKNTCSVVRETFGNKMGILDRAVHRVEYEKERQRAELEEKQKTKADLIAFNQIDWHDFTLVETIDLSPLKISPETNNGESKAVQSKPAATAPSTVVEEESDSDDVEMDLDDDSSDEEKLDVRDNYKPSVSKSQLTKNVVKLPDGREVATKDVNEHMRVEMLDPKWKQQRERYLERKKVVPFVEKDISQNLSNLARHRPDVFSTTEESSRIAQEEALEKKQKAQSSAWDGSLESVATLTAMSKQKEREAATKPEQEKETEYAIGPSKKKQKL